MIGYTAGIAAGYGELTSSEIGCDGMSVQYRFTGARLTRIREYAMN